MNRLTKEIHHEPHRCYRRRAGTSSRHPSTCLRSSIRSTGRARGRRRHGQNQPAGPASLRRRRPRWRSPLIVTPCPRPSRRHAGSHHPTGSALSIEGWAFHLVNCHKTASGCCSGSRIFLREKHTFLGRVRTHYLRVAAGRLVPRQPLPSFRWSQKPTTRGASP